MNYEINAQGKKIGRVASEAAKILMGKNRVDFARNKFPTVKVKILNASKADVTNKKVATTKYKSYSGYPGGLKTRTMKKIAADHGGGVLSEDTLCRHGDGDEPETVFSVVFTFKQGFLTVELASGNPCKTEYQTVWKS